MRSLSKSKLVAFRQCAKRVWLEVHEPSLAVYSADTQARFEAGNEVGALARRLYDPQNRGTTLDAQRDGFSATFERTRDLLKEPRPIFEAGFAAEGAMAFADVMLPASDGPRPRWRMVEVKSATSVKDYHHDDAAIQSYVARAAGADLEAIAVAHVDSTWVYPGGGDYRGLIKEEDLTEETIERTTEVAGWVAEAQRVVGENQPPQIGLGRHCHDPFDCPFLAHCRAALPAVEHPVEWLPNLRGQDVRDLIETKGVRDLRDIPDDLLNEQQLRVKRHTLSGEPYFDAAGARAALAKHKLPALFLDFETAQLAVPIWAGTRPYQQIPFQFSLHSLSADHGLSHAAHLDLTGQDPSESFARALIEACTGSGPIFVYNAAFESGRIKELAERYPRLAPALTALSARIVDLLPITRRFYYHPSQHGSWSIKAVLPAMAPDLSYDTLTGVKDGGMAMIAYLEAIRGGTSAARKAEIERQLLDYCRLDTLAMVRVWQFLSGNTGPLTEAAEQPSAERTGWATRLLRRVVGG